MRTVGPYGSAARGAGRGPAPAGCRGGPTGACRGAGGRCGAGPAAGRGIGAGACCAGGRGPDRANVVD
ncbi:MAG: hypothetical protein EKK42_23300 [Pseudonocardiaceae bacterium]|nr:MAG: hypothetical protein EKK42_23300 [Pseudonocardiaceae bacterium]